MHNNTKWLRTGLRGSLLLATLALSGCMNGDNEVSLDLGSVSIGQQLIDLQKARNAGAISAAEFQSGKASLLLLLGNTAKAIYPNRDGDGDDDFDVEIVISDEHDASDQENAKDEDDKDEDSGFLF